MDRIISDIDDVLIKICCLTGASLYTNDGSKIYVSGLYYFLEFFQQERYDEKLSCFFNFEEYSMFFEHVYEAISGEKFLFDEGLNDPKSFNRWYLLSVYDFIEANLVKLNEFPPEWFLKAVKIYSNELARNFPDLAIKNDEDGKSLWDAWSGRG